MMAYGRYKFYFEKPEDLSRASWEAYIDRKREMAWWIHKQKWDHWGTISGGNEGFWFDVEENYTAFLLRWS